MIRPHKLSTFLDGFWLSLTLIAIWGSFFDLRLVIVGMTLWNEPGRNVHISRDVGLRAGYTCFAISSS